MVSGSGALKTINSQVELLPLVTKFAGDEIDEGFRSFILSGGSPLHLCAMFVSTAGKQDVHALHALQARNHFRGNGGVSMPNVRRGIHVIDGCC